MYFKMLQKKDLKLLLFQEVGAVLAGVFVIICGCLTLVLICYCRMVRRRRALASVSIVLFR